MNKPNLTNNIDIAEYEFFVKHFDLGEVWDFFRKHRVEVIMLPDYQYGCYIDVDIFTQGSDAACYAVESNPLTAIVFGIKHWKDRHTNIQQHGSLRGGYEG